MPSAFEIIGHNAALQEHWLRRALAFVIDIIIVSVVSLLFWPFGILGWGWFIPLIGGVVWWLYSALLEGVIGGTVGKKLVSLHVVAVDGTMDLVRAVVRNVSKIYFVLILIDLIVGAATEGDPRQRFLDRIARTTVTRVDQQAYMEEQFRMMQHVPPHPNVPPGAYGPPPPAAAPPPGPQAAPPPQGQWPEQAGGWPGQSPPPSGTWPKHEWDEEGRLKPEMKYCTACGGQLVARGDGKLTCVRCGAVY